MRTLGCTFLGFRTTFIGFELKLFAAIFVDRIRSPMEIDMRGNSEERGELNGVEMCEERATNGPSGLHAATQRSDAAPVPSTPPGSAARMLRDIEVMGVRRNRLDDATKNWVVEKHGAWLREIGNGPSTIASGEWFAQIRVLGVEEDTVDPLTTADALRSYIMGVVSMRENALSCYPQSLSTRDGAEATKGL